MYVHSTHNLLTHIHYSHTHTVHSCVSPVVMSRHTSDLTKVVLIMEGELLESVLMLTRETLDGVFCLSFCHSQEVKPDFIALIMDFMLIFLFLFLLLCCLAFCLHHSFLILLSITIIFIQCSRLRLGRVYYQQISIH